MKHSRNMSANPRRLRRAALMAVAIAPGMLVGCGPQPQVDKDRSGISGIVTFAGKPLKAGTITFEATEKAMSSSISLGQDGRYRTNRVPLGKNIVTIETESLQYGSPQLYVRIPAKYADPSKSGLSVDVKPGDNEDVSFDLKP